VPRYIDAPQRQIRFQASLHLRKHTTTNTRAAFQPPNRRLTELRMMLPFYRPRPFATKQMNCLLVLRCKHHSRGKTDAVRIRNSNLNKRLFLDFGARHRTTWSEKLFAAITMIGRARHRFLCSFYACKSSIAPQFGRGTWTSAPWLMGRSWL
jgi:hypothetical protein